MADEQIIVEIKVEDSDIQKADKAINKLSGSIDILGKNIADTRKENKDLTTSIDALNKKEADGIKLTKEESDKRETLTKKLHQNQIELAKNQITLSKLKNEQKANIKVVQNEQSAYDALSAKLNIARKRAKDIGVQYGINSKEFKKAALNVQQMDKQLKRVDGTLGQHQRNVGGYTEALNNLSPGFNSVSQMGTKFLGVLKLIAINPIILILTGIVAALAAITAAFKKTQRGAELFQRISAGISAGFQVLTDLLAKVADMLISAFNDPIGSIKEFGRLLKENLINRFEAIGGFIGAIATAFKGEWANAFEQAKTAAIQLATGLDETQQNKFAESIKNVANEIKEEAKAAFELEQRLQNLKQLEIDTIRNRAELRRQIEESRESARNENLTLAERINYIKDAQDKTKELFDLEKSFARERAQIIADQVALGESSQEEIKEREEAFARVDELAAAQARQQKRLLEEYNSLYKKAIKEREEIQVLEINTFEENLKRKDELLQIYSDEEINKLQKRVQLGGEIRQQDIEKQKEQTQIITSLWAESFAIIGEEIANQEGSMRNAFKRILLMALDFLQSMVPIFAAQIAGVSFSGADNIFTLGVSGAARYLATVAVLEGLVSVAKVSVKKFEHGTSDIVGIGDSHASGNDVTVVGYDKRGNSQIFGKVEKGEAMPVIKKNAVNDYIVAKLNGNFADAGSKRTFASGTNDIMNPQQSQQIRIEDMIKAFQSINIGVKVEDITEQQMKKVEVYSNSSF